MQIVSIHNAKTNLSKYIAAVKTGDQIFIGGFGNPEVKLTRVTPADLAHTKTRDFSCAHHKVAEHTDSFSDATDDLVNELLLGS